MSSWFYALLHAKNNAHSSFTYDNIKRNIMHDMGYKIFRGAKIFKIFKNVTDLNESAGILNDYFKCQDTALANNVAINTVGAVTGMLGNLGIWSLLIFEIKTDKI